MNINLSIPYPYTELTGQCKNLRKILYSPNTPRDEFFDTVDKLYEIVRTIRTWYDNRQTELKEKCNESVTDEEAKLYYQQLMELGSAEEFMSYATGLDDNSYCKPSYYSILKFVNDDGYSRAATVYKAVKSIYNDAKSEEEINMLNDIMKGIKGMISLAYHHKRYCLDRRSLGVYTNSLFKRHWESFRQLGSCDYFIRQILL